MLVLTRRSKDKISFPQVGITIQFLRVQSGQVKVGIDAPREITILRDEVASASEAAGSLQRQISHLPKDVRHGIRNELQQISIGIHLYKELVSSALCEEALDVFTQIQDSLRRLDSSEALNAPQPEMPLPGSPVVLVVEDDSNEREMLAGCLRLRDMQVVSVADGNEAIAYFRDHPAPGYLLIDMHMPECDGPTAIETLRGNGKLDATRVFAISGMSPEFYGVAIGESGVDRWFPKPLNPANLIDAMSASLN